MRTLKVIAFCALLSLAAFRAGAQSLPVGSGALEDQFRRQQLMGNNDTTVSFTIRPLFPASLNKKYNPFYPDSTEKRTQPINSNLVWHSVDGTSSISLLPFSLQTQFNSDHPYGWNDGAMIPAKGLQSLLSIGAFAQFGPLTIQFKPELVLAANSEFETLSSSHYDVLFARYYDIYNNVDLPVRFGTQAYNKLYFGQSSIRLNYKAMSFGLSTENLWWGPGIRNSLLMSNTAPGFAHLTLNTVRPVKTAIGSFEGQLIGGRLGNSGFAPLEPDHSFFNTNLYVPKPDDWRYLAGIIVTWQPKWIPGLFLGYDQSSQTYGKDLNGLKDYLPLFSPVKTSQGPDAPINKQDQLYSVFMRWLWTQEHAEFYFEYGKYNSSQDLTQSILAPNNSRAYVFGLRKLLPFRQRADENILLSVEVTQLQGTSAAQDRLGMEWYVSKNIRQGYTNQGQELGAGIGPGGNLQSVDISWVKGLKRIGLQLERYQHDNDFYYYAFSDSKDYTRHWVDLSMAFSGEWNYKNLIFNAKLQGIRSLDYQWALQHPGNDITFSNQVIKFNFQAQAGVTYRF